MIIIPRCSDNQSQHCNDIYADLIKVKIVIATIISLKGGDDIIVLSAQ